jgi:hypothetical protein
MDTGRLTTAEIKLLRLWVGYGLLNHRRNEDISEELKVDTVEKKVAHCIQKWLDHVSRTEYIGIQNSFLTVDLLEEDLDDR